MLFRVLFWLSLAVIGGAIVIALLVIARRPLKPFARNLLLVLIGLEIAVAGAHLVSLANTMPPFWDWFFDLQLELNLGSIFSSLQLMVIALAALLIAFTLPVRQRWRRAYWLLLAAGFAFLSIDEFYALHETMGSRVETDAWRIPYALAGLGLFALTAAAYWFGFRRQVRLFALLFIGFIIMAVAGIGIEEFALRGWVSENQNARWMYVFEEVFEMVGATIILAGMISFLQERLSGERWVRAGRVLVAGGTIWTLWLLFVLLFQARLEAALLAQPANVEFEGGLRLVGYRFSPAVVRPGGEIELTLYWEAEAGLPEDYSLSVHALSHPEIASVAQSDDLHTGPIPSRAWFPHVVLRRTVWIQLPDDLPAPQSYWLMVRVWFGPWPLGRPWQDTTGVPVVDAGQARPLAHDSIILDAVAALPEAKPPAPVITAVHTFPTEGIHLEGYDLPQEPVTASEFGVRFWWRTDAPPPRDLQQFFQLIDRETGAVFSFDQPPFGGRFPTSDWPANEGFVDEWAIVIPDDMPPGSYDVLTGLYDLTTMERATVVDADGNPVEANSIYLGALEYRPPAAES